MISGWPLYGVSGRPGAARYLILVWCKPLLDLWRYPWIRHVFHPSCPVTLILRGPRHSGFVWRRFSPAGRLGLPSLGVRLAELFAGTRSEANNCKSTATSLRGDMSKYPEAKLSVGPPSLRTILWRRWPSAFQVDPDDTRRWINVGSTLVQRRRRWTNVKTTLIQRYPANVTSWNVCDADPTLNQHWFNVVCLVLELASQHDRLTQCWCNFGPPSSILTVQ